MRSVTERTKGVLLKSFTKKLSTIASAVQSNFNMKRLMGAIIKSKNCEDDDRKYPVVYQGISVH